MEEKQAIELFLQTQSEESFCALFESLYARIRRYLMLRGLEAATAEELAQNVMFIVYQRAGEVRERELFQGWLFKVVKNELMRYWRHERARSEIAKFEPLSDDLADRLTAETDTTRNLDFAEWLNYLEPAEREIVILRYVEGLSYEELGVALGIPIGTVKWRLFNAKKKLSPILTSPPSKMTRRIN
ncbi:MAG TPA: sigma-70 family RNA polymerase sigma factor [Blastocatellia bacterium]|nr:sigma-70 family RNA polymerase sigma factor [Blastocatellia bacterium]